MKQTRNRKPYTQALIESKVERLPWSGCWIWPGHARGQLGYGCMSFQGKSVMAHRVVWSLFQGPVPKGMLVLHKCDVPACVNPTHLYLGNHSDNMRDMHDRKRAYRKRLFVGGTCSRGHALSANTIYIKPNGIRNCKLCRKA